MGWRVQFMWKKCAKITTFWRFFLKKIRHIYCWLTKYIRILLNVLPKLRPKKEEVHKHKTRLKTHFIAKFWCWKKFHSQILYCYLSQCISPLNFEFYFILYYFIAPPIFVTLQIPFIWGWTRDKRVKLSPKERLGDFMIHLILNYYTYRVKKHITC